MTTGDVLPWAIEWWNRAGWPEYALFFGLLALGILLILWLFIRCRLRPSTGRRDDETPRPR